MNPFVSKFTGSSPIAPISAMAVVLGFMMSTAWVTEGARRRASDPEQQVRLAQGSLGMQERVKRQDDEIKSLNEQLTRLQNSVAQETGQARILNDTLQKLKQYAGLTEVTGPGIALTLKDAPESSKMDAFAVDRIVHDTDVLRAVNELWNAGAEAISVNNLRVSVSTNFRCVGTTILVDSTKIASPIVIQAIGDGPTMMGAIKMPEGFFQQLTDVDPRMVSVELVERMKLPAYTGPTTHKFAKPVSPDDKEGEETK